MTTFTPRPVLAVGKLAASITAAETGGAFVTEPALSADKVLWDSDNHVVVSGAVADASVSTAALLASNPAIRGGATRFRQLILALKTNINGKIHFRNSADGLNWDFVDTFTYTAADATTGEVFYKPRARRVQVSFEDDAAAGPPTTWRFQLEGDESVGL